MRLLGQTGLIGLAAVTSGLLVLASNHDIKNRHRYPMLIGMYTTEPRNESWHGLDLNHQFISWIDPSAAKQLMSFLADSTIQTRVPLVTLEPFPKTDPDGDDRDLHADVLSGQYDKQLQEIKQVLKAHKGTVLLRFAHEMDKPGQYPWAWKEPKKYIQLYRYVHTMLNSADNKQIRWVWSPIGRKGAEEFWPGKDYVDLIGLSVYASRAWTEDGSLPSFSELFSEKRWLHDRYRKPVIVAEMGVSGSSKDQTIWLKEAIDNRSNFPELCGLVYFQAQQPRWMPLPTGHEDWRLKPESQNWIQTALPLKPQQALRCLET
jgi:beta-mannanase